MKKHENRIKSDYRATIFASLCGGESVELKRVLGEKRDGAVEETVPDFVVERIRKLVTYRVGEVTKCRQEYPEVISILFVKFKKTYNFVCYFFTT